MLDHQLALKVRSRPVIVAQVGRSVTCTNFTATASATVAGEHLLVHRVARSTVVRGLSQACAGGLLGVHASQAHNSLHLTL